MTTFAVFCPKGAEPEEVPERLVFVRQRMSFWALVLPPVWILGHGLWLTFLFWFAAAAAVGAAISGFAPNLAAVLLVLFAIWFALSARDFQEWTLSRRGWRLVGIVEARGRRAAEAEFFNTHCADVALPRDAEARTPSPARRRTPPRFGADAVLGFEGFRKETP